MSLKDVHLDIVNESNIPDVPLPKTLAVPDSLVLPPLIEGAIFLSSLLLKLKG